MSKNTDYLNTRAKKALRVDELKVKDLTLNTLMTAYASVYQDGDLGNDQRITMKIPALATHYATLLCQGKFVVINDPFENRRYFVVAHNEDLIAVCYAIGPWSNFYSIKCTSEDTLRELNILTPCTNDLKVIDRIFNFPSNMDDEDHTPATAVIEPDNGLRWDWHTGHKPATKKDQKEVDNAVATTEADVHVQEVAIAGGPEGRPVVQVGGNQMQRAFKSAEAGNQGHGRRAERRHNERRAHELNTPQATGEKQGS